MCKKVPHRGIPVARLEKSDHGKGSFLGQKKALFGQK